MGGKGEVIIFVGSLASVSHVSWANGAVGAINSKYPEMKVANAGGVFIETGNNAANAYEKAKEALKAYPNATGIFCTSSTDTPSVARAIEEAGLVDTITYVACGLPNATRTYISNGAIDWLVSWDPALIGLVMCRVAGAVKAGVPIKDGDDLGAFGYTKITLKDKVIMGNEWHVISAANVANFNF
jgi:simple sugar transport system substrate-binding protein